MTTLAELVNNNFVRYCRARDVASSDQALEHLLTALKNLLSEGPKECIPEALLAQLAIVFALQLSRRRIFIVDGGNFKNVRGSFQPRGSESAEFASLVNLVDALDSQHRKALPAEPAITIAWRTDEPMELIGYDPRQPDPTKAAASWMDYTPRLLKQPTFKATYQAAKAAIYRDFHDRSTRYDLLLVDFAWLPELAYRGHVYPFEHFASGVPNRIEAALSDSAAWLPVLHALSQAGNREHYALPVCLNLHGMLTSIGASPLPQEPRLWRHDELQLASVQAMPSASCVYELHAHFAFTGAEPITVDQDNYKVRNIDYRSEASRKAFAQYLYRLLGFHHAQYGPFQIAHGEQKDGVKVGAWKYAPTFNSELWDTSLGTWYSFSPPLKNTTAAQWLTSFGGYGLAVSRHALDPERACNTAWALFEKVAPTTVPAHVRTFATPLSTAMNSGNPAQFIRQHCRPRIPFWTHVEESVAMALRHLYDTYYSRPAQWRNTLTVEVLEADLEGKDGSEVLKRLEDAVVLTFENNGWG